MNRRRLLKAMVCGAALTAITPSFAAAQPGAYYPTMTPYESSISNALGKWSARVAAAGGSINLDSTRAFVAKHLTSAGTALRGTPWLRVAGKFMGPAGIVLAMAGGATLLSSDGEYISVLQRLVGSAMPSNYSKTGAFVLGQTDNVLSDIGKNASKFYAAVSRLFRTEWSDAQHLTTAGKGKYGPEWVWRHSKIDAHVEQVTDPQTGDLVNHFGHVFEYVGTNKDRPYFPPLVPLTSPAGAADLAGVQGQTVTDASSADHLRRVLEAAAAAAGAAGEPIPFPVPVSAYPPIPGDFADLPLTGGALTGAIPDRAVSVGNPVEADAGTGNPTVPTAVSIDWGAFNEPEFTLPPLTPPEIPTVPDLLDQLANPLQAIIPTPPPGGAVCPPFPWFMGQEVTQHCGVVATMQPWLGNLCRVMGNVTAFFLVLRE